jgi:hypothetical protein
MSAPVRDPYADPHAPAERLVPFGCVPATPTPDEERVWQGAVRTVAALLQYQPRDLRVLWFTGDGGPLVPNGQAVPSRPPLVLLRSGRPLDRLRWTCVHELRHCWQFEYLPDWGPDERERDAAAFADRYASDLLTR